MKKVHYGKKFTSEESSLDYGKKFTGTSEKSSPNNIDNNINNINTSCSAMELPPQNVVDSSTQNVDTSKNNSSKNNKSKNNKSKNNYSKILSIFTFAKLKIGTFTHIFWIRVVNLIYKG